MKFYASAIHLFLDPLGPPSLLEALKLGNRLILEADRPRFIGGFVHHTQHDDLFYVVARKPEVRKYMISAGGLLRTGRRSRAASRKRSRGRMSRP